jgi:phosphatidylglycerol---prolipoprotein diacylglyceryl transferase
VYPVLVEPWGVSIGTHSFFVGLGVLLGAVVVVRESRRRRMWGDEMLVAVAGGLVGGALGMRAAGLVRSLDLAANPPLLLAWQYGVKSVLGGLTGAYVGVLVGKRVAGYGVSTGDVFAPAAALGMAVGRIGCLLTEPPGRPTSLPWGITMTARQIAATPGCDACRPGVPMHPSFAYEIVFHLAALVVLLVLRDRLARPGALFTLYLAGYAAFRFGVEFTRANEVVAGGLTRGQWFLLAVMPLLAVRLVTLTRTARGPRPTRPEEALDTSGPAPRPHRKYCPND